MTIWKLFRVGGIAMPYRTDDPVADFDRWDTAMEQSRNRHYMCRCAQCREPLYDYDDYYDFDGDKVHEDCMLDWVERFKR